MAKVWWPAGSSVLAASQLESVAVSAIVSPPAALDVQAVSPAAPTRAAAARTAVRTGTGFSWVRVMVVSRR